MASRDGEFIPHAQGRRSHGGPTSGGYVTWAVTVDNLANTETPEFDFVAPAALRIMEVSSGCETVGTTGATVAVVNGATSLVAAYTITATPTVNTLVASDAARNMAKGDLLHVNLNATTGALTGVVVFITAYVRGHVNAEAVND